MPSKWPSRVVFVLALALAFPPFGCTDAIAAPAVAGPTAVPGELIVKFRAGTAAADRQAILAELGGVVKQVLPLTGAVCLKSGPLGVAAAVATYGNDPAIEYIEPNYTWYANFMPNDPRFADLWGLHNTGLSAGTADSDIDAPEAWDATTGNGSVLVAVIDTGIDYNHPDLAANIWTNPGEVAGNGLDDDGNGLIDDIHGYDFVNGDGNPMDDHSHGTHCAGTIGAIGNNGLGVAGVCWNVRIMGVKFLDAGGGGTTEGAISALGYAVRMGARILSNSWGGGSYSAALRDAIATAGSTGAIFVASAGNAGSNNDTYPTYPASYDLDNIVTVAATDRNDLLAGFSCWGATSVDLGAPGVDVLSTTPGSSYSYKSGTSMACPHVAGALALAMSRFPGMTVASAKALVLNNVEGIASLQGKTLTGGRLNVNTMMAGPDSIAPAPIFDLAIADVSGQWVDLSWTATGDDGSSGTARVYDLRYATFPITEANFASATPVLGLLPPQSAGSAELRRVTGLVFETPYWFAVRARDEYSQLSDMGNAVDAVTAPPPAVAVAPDSLAVTLFPGGTTSRMVTISNTGYSELAWSGALQWPSAMKTVTLRALPVVDAAKVDISPAKAQPPAGHRSAGTLTAALRDLSGVEIMWEQSHGQDSNYNWSMLVGDLTSRGAQVVVNTSPLTPTSLVGIDVVWTRETWQPWSPSEISTLAAWLSAGGAMLFEGDESPVAFNSLLTAAGAGITFGGYANAGMTTAIMPHETTRDVDSLYISNPLTALSIVESPAGLLALDTATHAVMAWSSVGAGRIVTICDEILADGLLTYGSNRLFGNQAFDWLAAPSWLSLAPRAGIVPPGQSRDVTLSFMSADLCGARESAVLNVSSNDPLSPVSAVAVQLDVYGLANLTVRPDSLSWEDQYLGAVLTDTLVVGNDGCNTLVVSGLAVDSADFAVSPAGPFTLAARSAQNVLVTYAPVTVGPVAGTLTIASDDPDEPVRTVSLTGTGVVPPVIRVRPDSLTVMLAPGGSTSRLLTIDNDGPSELVWTVDVLRADGSIARDATFMFDDLPPDPEAMQHDADNGATTAPETFGQRTYRSDKQLPTMPRTLLYTSLSSANDAYALALRGLGVGFTLVTSWSTLTSALVTNGPWDLVVVNSYGSRPETADLNALVAHLDGDGALIFADWDVYEYTGHPLLARLGVSYQSDFTTPKDFSAVDPAHRCFNDPNTTTNWQWDSDGASRDGQVMSVRAGAHALASFVGLPGSGAIVLNADRNALFNGFQTDNFTRDGDGDGRRDIVELAENEITLVGGFVRWLQMEPESGTVPPGESRDVTLAFDGTDLCGTTEAGLVQVSSNDPLSPVVSVPVRLDVYGLANLTVQPDSISWGPQFLGATLTDTLVVGNDGCNTLAISGLAVDSADFTVSPTGGFTLAPRTAQNVLVTYAPVTVGAVAGTLTIASDDPDEPSRTVALSGAGVMPPVLVVAPDSLAVGLTGGTNDTRVVTISNQGASDLSWSATVGNYSPSRRYTLSAPAPVPWVPVDSQSPASAAAPPPNVAVELTASLRDLTGVRILWDRYHGEEALSYSYSAMAASLRTRGAEVVESSTALSPQVLASCDLLWMREFPSACSAAETAALVDWIRQGGGLLLEGDGSPANFNAILSAMGAGIVFGGGATSGTTTNIVSHETTMGVQSLYLAGPGTSLATVASPAGVLARDVYGIAALAWSESGKGRIVALCDEVLLDYGMSFADNHLFGNQVVDWLAAPSWLAVEPASGVLTSGAQQDMTVTFDAEKYCGGSFAADIAVRSNDPRASRIVIPARMDVIGGANISLARSRMAFGAQFVGAVATDTLRVSNTGCWALTISGITTDNPEFTVAPGTPLTLAPGASVLVAVTYTPATLGEVAAVLSIFSDDVDMPQADVALAGAAIEPPIIAVTPDSLSASLAPGTNTTRHLLIENRGASALDWSLSILGETQAATVGSAVRLSSATPRTLVLNTYDMANDGYLLALQRLGWEYDEVHNWDWLATAMETMGPWDLVIVSSYTTTATAAALADLTAHVDGGGKLIFADYAMYGFRTNALFARMGVTTPTIFATPMNVVPVGPSQRCFQWPNRIGGLYWHQNQYSVDGQVVDVLPGAVRLAAFADYPSRAAIVLNATGRTIFNGFQSANYGGDDDADGIADMIELAENEILLVTNRPAWLEAAPDAGTIAAGAFQDVTVTFDAALICGGDASAAIEVTSNDPVSPVRTVPAFLSVAGAAGISVSREAIAFGRFYAGLAVTDSLVITNPGCGALDVTGMTVNDAEFSMAPAAPFTVAPGATRVVRVTFAPMEPRAVTAALTIASNAADHPELVIALSGEAESPPVLTATPDSIAVAIGPGAIASRVVTIRNEGGASLRWVATRDETGLASGPGGAATPRILIVPGYDSAGNVFTTALQRRGLSFTSTGDWNTAFSQMTRYGPWDLVIIDSPDANFLADLLNALATHVARGGAVIFSDPGLSGYATHPLLSELGVVYGTTLDHPLDIALTNSAHPLGARPNGVNSWHWGVDSYRADGQVVSVLPDAHQLAAFAGYPTSGAVVWGRNGRTIFNAFQTQDYRADGDADGKRDMLELAENELALVGVTGRWLSVEPVMGVLPPGGEQDVSLRFDAGSLCGVDLPYPIVLVSNDPVRGDVAVPTALSVQAAPAMSTRTTGLDFGANFIGARKGMSFAVRNRGCAALSVASVRSDQPEFVVAAGGPCVIAPGDSQMVSVTYAPATAGSLAGVLSIEGDDPSTPSIFVPLSGVGVDAPVLSVSVDSLSVTLSPDETTTRILTIRNTGRHDMTWSAGVSGFTDFTVLETSSCFSGAAIASDEKQPDGLADSEASGAAVMPALPGIATSAPAPDADTVASWQSRSGLVEQSTVSAPTTPVVVLDDVLVRLDAGYAAVTRRIPDAYQFTDGVTGAYITDGGADMYDGGNAIYTDLNGPVSYRDGQITRDAAFGNGRCFTRKLPGLFVLAADLINVGSLAVTGGLGADGAGRVDGAVLRMTMRSGRSYLGMVKRVYGAGDPSVNHLVIVEATPTVSQNFPTSTDSDGHTINGLVGQTRLYYLLYAGANGGYIDNQQAGSIMGAFLATIENELWLSVEPASGTVAAGASCDVTASCDATGLDAGDRLARIMLETNDPLRRESVFPVRLRVLPERGALSVTIGVGAGALTSEVIRLGVGIGANDGYDPGRDMPVNVPAPGYPSAWFPHPGWANEAGECFGSDQRAPFDLESSSKTWRFAVTAGQPGPVTLTIVPESPLPLATRLLLLDLQDGSTQDLVTDPHFNYVSTGPETRMFAVRVGTDLPVREPSARALAPGWSLVGVPLALPAGTTVSDAMLAQAPAGSWLYAWDPVRDLYDVLGAGAPCVPGRGLWFYGAGAYSWGPSGPLALDEMVLPLEPGWNLVGYPLWFRGDLRGVLVERNGERRTFAEAVAAGFIASVGFGFENGAYSLSTDLVPWRGYWIASYVDGAALVFDHVLMSVDKRQTLPEATDTSEPAGDWAVAVRALGGNSHVIFGQSVGASDGLDADRDLPSPPANPTEVFTTLSMPRPEWTNLAGLEFQRDLRAGGSRNLKFAVRVRSTADAVRIAWDPAELPEGRDFAVLAGSQVLVSTMRGQDSVELTMGGGMLDLEFAEVSGNENLPTAPALDLRNRPNPFNPSTDLLFNLPQAGRVELLVHDARGVLVRRLDAGQLPSGPSSVTWNGLDQRGKPAGSGVYLYRLLCDGRQLGPTRKMMLLK